jgi:hypothetical protein
MYLTAPFVLRSRFVPFYKKAGIFSLKVISERIKSNFSMYLLDNQLLVSLLPVVPVGLQNRLKRRFGCCERRKVSKYCIDYEDFQ